MDIHPLEVAAQQALEEPLQTLNLHLTALYESQLVLERVLQRLQGTLGRIVELGEPSISEEVLDRVLKCEERVRTIEQILAQVEDRLER